jgi:putative oxidoreductase
MWGVKAMRTYGRIARFLESLGAAFGITALRISIGIIYLWFGVPKFFPGMSPAEPLAVETVERLTFGIVSGTTASVLTGALEALIGILLISGKFHTLTIMVLLGHMAGTFTPLFMFPKETWDSFLIGTLEGQYILKNLVIVTAALAIAGHSRTRKPLTLVKRTVEPVPPTPMRIPSASADRPLPAPDRAG